MRPSRRGLLLAGGATALLGVGPHPPRRPKNLAIVLAWGAWDTTAGLDPKPQAPAPLPEGRLATFGEIDVWASDNWPAVTRFMDEWSPRMHVVRGIAVRSVAHVIALRRLLTGTPDPGAPDLGAIVGSHLGGSVPLPYLMLGVRGMPGSLASVSATVGLRNQLATLTGDRPLDPSEAEAVAKAVAASDARFGARTLGDAARAKAQALQISRTRASALLGADLGPPGSTRAFTDQVEVAVRALSGGLSRAVMLDTQLDFDTHVENYRQAALTDSLFDGLGTLMSALSTTPATSPGRTLLDDTLVVVISEMTRTPRMNAFGGKDHWPWATVALLGAGVSHGVSGRTDDEQVGQPISLSHGGFGEVELRAEHLFAGVLEHMGIDPLPHTAASPLRAFIA